MWSQYGLPTTLKQWHGCTKSASRSMNWISMAFAGLLRTETGQSVLPWLESCPRMGSFTLYGLGLFRVIAGGSYTESLFRFASLTLRGTSSPRSPIHSSTAQLPQTILSNAALSLIDLNTNGLVLTSTTGSKTHGND